MTITTQIETTDADLVELSGYHVYQNPPEDSKLDVNGKNLEL